MPFSKPDSIGPYRPVDYTSRSIYAPLNPEEKEIRLLYLDPGIDFDDLEWPIRCTISHVSLQSAGFPSYHAISVCDKAQLRSTRTDPVHVVVVLLDHNSWYVRLIGGRSLLNSIEPGAAL